MGALNEAGQKRATRTSWTGYNSASVYHQDLPLSYNKKLIPEMVEVKGAIYIYKLHRT